MASAPHPPTTGQIGQPERATQNRVVALLRDELGYRGLGDWTDRADNSNIEETLLTDWLHARGVTPAQTSVVLPRPRRRRFDSIPSWQRSLPSASSTSSCTRCCIYWSRRMALDSRA